MLLKEAYGAPSKRWYDGWVPIGSGSGDMAYIQSAAGGYCPGMSVHKINMNYGGLRGSKSTGRLMASFRDQVIVDSPLELILLVMEGM